MRYLSQAILTAILLLLVQAAQAAQMDQVAIINLEAVFEKSALVEHRSQQLRTTSQEVQARLEAMTTEVKNLETEVSIRPTTHPRHAEFREQLEIAKLRRDLYRDRQASRLQGREMELLRESYEDMRQLLAEFAKENQLQLIMMASNSPIEASAVQSMRLQMGQRNVLYFAEELDLTEAFVEFANSRFRGPEEGADESGEGAP